MFKKLTHISALAVSLIFVSITCDTRADTLQGGVAKIEAIDLNLRPGAIYDQSKIANRISNWYRIPVWLAGTRERTEIRSAAGIVKNIRRRERGRQFDSQGNIWEASREPIFYDIDRGELVSHTILKKTEPLQLSRNQVTLRLSGTMIAAKKRGNVIIDVMQWEEVHTMVPGPNNTVEAVISETRNYDMDGKLTVLDTEPKYYSEDLVAEFTPVDKDARFNYKEEFANFLHNAGKDELIPR